MKSKLTFWNYFRSQYIIPALFILVLSIVSFVYSIDAGFSFLGILMLLIILSYNSYKKYKYL